MLARVFSFAQRIQIQMRRGSNTLTGVQTNVLISQKFLINQQANECCPFIGYIRCAHNRKWKRRQNASRWTIIDRKHRLVRIQATVCGGILCCRVCSDHKLLYQFFVCEKGAHIMFTDEHLFYLNATPPPYLDCSSVLFVCNKDTCAGNLFDHYCVLCVKRFAAESAGPHKSNHSYKYLYFFCYSFSTVEYIQHETKTDRHIQKDSMLNIKPIYILIALRASHINIYSGVCHRNPEICPA